ncbi:MFS transporter [Nonomuraea fuscirosea]
MADRYPRRRVMVVADLARAALVLVMALPGMSLPEIAILVVAVVTLNAPFNAARSATLVDVLPGDRYPLGRGITNTTQQAVRLLGFGGGGLIVAALGPNISLVLNAATFVIRLSVHLRPPAAPSGDRAKWFGRSALSSVRTWWSDRRLRYFAARSDRPRRCHEPLRP